MTKYLVALTLRRMPLTVLAVLVTCGVGAQSNDNIRSLGEYTVGSTLTQVHKLKHDDNCLIEGEQADCTFTDVNGVEYVVLDRNVIAVISNGKRTSNVVLPLGLSFGEDLYSVVCKLVATGTGRWLLGTNHAGGLALSSSQTFVGDNDWHFFVELQFSSNRLTEIKYNSGSI